MRIRALFSVVLMMIVLFLLLSYYTRKQPSSTDVINLAVFQNDLTRPSQKNLDLTGNSTVKYQRPADENYRTDSVNSSLCWNAPPEGTQMGDKQIMAIKSVIPPHGNILVWGLGYDSPFWNSCSDGKVIFIESETTWYDKVTKTYPNLKAFKVNYTTDLEKSYQRYFENDTLWQELDIRSQLPAVVKETTWHVILVDAPMGFAPEQPGRYQSIYTSIQLAFEGTHIFIDDYERKVERQFSLKWLGNPIEVVSRHNNEQAHFVFTKHKI